MIRGLKEMASRPHKGREFQGTALLLLGGEWGHSALTFHFWEKQVLKCKIELPVEVAGLFDKVDSIGAVSVASEARSSLQRYEQEEGLELLSLICRQLAQNLKIGTILCKAHMSYTHLSWDCCLACEGLSQMEEEVSSVSLEGEGRWQSPPTWGRRKMDLEQKD